MGHQTDPPCSVQAPPLVCSALMDADVRRSMLRYYNECAAEYEETVLFGARSASIPDPNVFRSEGRTLAAVIERIVSGRVIDIACGTAFWLQHYAARCSHVTLFDQSEKMLAEAKRKVSQHLLDDRCVTIRGNFFEHDFPLAAYDSAFTCFFLSHLNEQQEAGLFARLHQMLGTSGRFVICDSAWTAERARFNRKIEHQQRQLDDGTAFTVYKRYCDQDDIAGWKRKYGVRLQVEHFGTAFYAVSGAFVTESPATLIRGRRSTS